MERLKQIVPADRSAYRSAEERWDSIAKPLGSFGLLEEAVKKIASVQGTADISISKCTAVVMCGDHGVTAEGITQCGSEVTAECARAIAEGRSNINAVASPFGIDVVAVDAGIRSDVDCSRLINRKVAYGTKNMAVEPAMTPEQTRQAIEVGINMVRDLKKNGTDLIIAGEMGIGNTTSASAIASVMLGLPSEKVTGRGAGLSSEGLERKKATVRRAIEVNKPDRNSPLDVLSKLGGFEIAGMTGLFLGGAVYHVPVVADGIISCASAVIACKTVPVCSEYILASHSSGEPCGDLLLELCGLVPIIRAGLKLGEGTGGVLLVPLIEGALSLYRNSHRFEETSIERYVRLK